MDLYKKILELDSVYEGDGQLPGSFETNNPNEAIKEIVKRFFPGVNAQIPISENLQLNLGPSVNEISAGGQFDVGGGELSIGGGMRGDDKAFGIGFRKAFGDGSVTAVKKLDKRVTGKDPRLVKLFNKGELYHLRLGSDKKVYYGTKKELDEIFKNRKRAGGDTTIGLEKKKYPKNFLPRSEFLKFLKKNNIKAEDAANFASRYNIKTKPNPYNTNQKIYSIAKFNDKFIEKIQKRQVRTGQATDFAKEKFPVKTKYETTLPRLQAIEEKEGIKKDSPLKGKRKLKVDMGHAGNIFSNFSDELITLDKLTYTPSEINEILGKKGGVDDKIRAIQNSQFKVINKMNDADAAKYMDNNKIPYNKASSNFKRQLLNKSDATLTRLVLDSGGEKVARLSDGTTFGGSFLKSPVDKMDMYKGVTEKDFVKFRSQYLTNEGNLKPNVLTDEAKKAKTKIKLTDTNDFTNIIKQDLPNVDKKNLIDLKIFEDNRISSMQSASANELRPLANIGCPNKKADGGRVNFSDGQDLVACAIKGAEKLQNSDPKKLDGLAKSNIKTLTKTASGARFLKNVLGPGAIAFEGLFALPFAALDFAEGRKGSDILKNALSLGFMDSKLREDELKEFFSGAGKGEEFIKALNDVQRLSKQTYQGTKKQKQRAIPLYNKAFDRFEKAMEPFMRVNPQLEAGQMFSPELLEDNIRKTEEAREEVLKTYDERLKERGIGPYSKPFDFSYGEFSNGGIAGLSGGDKSGPPPERGPDSEGLRSLMKRGINL